MLAAIDFDDHPSLLANEVRNVVPDRLLPAPFRIQSAGTQFPPQPSFRIGHIPSQTLGTLQGQIGISDQATSPSGASTSALNACISSAPVAPSIARWSKLPVAVITEAMASASSTT